MDVRVAPEALAHVLQVFGLAARAPHQAQADEGRGEIPEAV
jgi:hypothetical protein